MGFCCVCIAIVIIVVTIIVISVIVVAVGVPMVDELHASVRNFHIKWSQYAASASASKETSVRLEHEVSRLEYEMKTLRAEMAIMRAKLAQPDSCVYAHVHMHTLTSSLNPLLSNMSRRLVAAQEEARMANSRCGLLI